MNVVIEQLEIMPAPEAPPERAEGRAGPEEREPPAWPTDLERDLERLRERALRGRAY